MFTVSLLCIVSYLTTCVLSGEMCDYLLVCSVFKWTRCSSEHGFLSISRLLLLLKTVYQDNEVCGHILQKKSASVCSLKDNESQIIPSSLYLNSLIMGTANSQFLTEKFIA